MNGRPSNIAKGAFSITCTGQIRLTDLMLIFTHGMSPVMLLRVPLADSIVRTFSDWRGTRSCDQTSFLISITWQLVSSIPSVFTESFRVSSRHLKGRECLASNNV